MRMAMEVIVRVPNANVPEVRANRPNCVGIVETHNSYSTRVMQGKTVLDAMRPVMRFVHPVNFELDPISLFILDLHFIMQVEQVTQTACVRIF